MEPFNKLLCAAVSFRFVSLCFALRDNILALYDEFVFPSSRRTIARNVVLLALSYSSIICRCYCIGRCFELLAFVVVAFRVVVACSMVVLLLVVVVMCGSGWLASGSSRLDPKSTLCGSSKH